MTMLHRPERIMTTTHTTPARVGRERTCTQCGATYRSPRNSSLYCSPACRKKANRGSAPTAGPKAGPATFSPITKALLVAGYVGPITGSKSEPVYALTTPCDHALAELSYQFNRKGWGNVSRDEFAEALRADGIRAFDTRSPQAAERKQWQDRQRQRINRAA